MASSIKQLHVGLVTINGISVDIEAWKDAHQYDNVTIDQPLIFPYYCLKQTAARRCYQPVFLYCEVDDIVEVTQGAITEYHVHYFSSGNC